MLLPQFFLSSNLGGIGYKGEGHYRGLLKKVKGKYSQKKQRYMLE